MEEEYFENLGDEPGKMVDIIIRHRYNIKREEDEGNEPVYNISGCRVKIYKNSPEGKISVECDEEDLSERAKKISGLILNISQETGLNFILSA